MLCFWSCQKRQCCWLVYVQFFRQWWKRVRSFEMSISSSQWTNRASNGWKDSERKRKKKLRISSVKSKWDWWKCIKLGSMPSWRKECEREKKKQIYIKETGCATVQIIWGRSKAKKSRKKANQVYFHFVKSQRTDEMKRNSSQPKRQLINDNGKTHTRADPCERGRPTKTEDDASWKKDKGTEQIYI